MTLIYILGYRFFYWGKRLRKRFPFLGKIVRKYEYYFSHFANDKLTKWYDKHPVKWGLNTKQREEQYTVSLTSFPTRIPYVHIAIETLMRQSFKPDRIVLWLAESQFPDHQLPERLTELEKKGLTIRYCEDLRSHKKYHYVFQEYPDDNIILADDDVFYSRDMIYQLVKLHRKYKSDIIGTIGQAVGPTVSSMPSVWPVPDRKKKYRSTFGIQPFSGQGTLYPARWYTDELFNKENAMRLAKTADDMWLQAMSYLAGTKNTLLYPMRGFPVQIDINNNESLYQINNSDGGNMNDHIWKALDETYQLGQLGINLKT